MKRAKRTRVWLDKNELCSLICLIGASRECRIELDLTDVTWREVEATVARLHAALSIAARGKAAPRTKPRRSAESRARARFSSMGLPPVGGRKRPKASVQLLKRARAKRS